MAMSLEDAIGQLLHSQAPKRRSAVRQIRKLRSPQAGPHLLSALRKETESRGWETQFLVTLALGDCGYRDALPFLEELTDWEFDATILYVALGDAIVRLSAGDCHDADPVLRLLERGNESLANGALHALATMRIIPADDAVTGIINYASELPLDSETRVYVATAAAGWNRDLTEEFLLECQAATPNKNPRVSPAAASALNGKYYNFSQL